MNTLATRIAAAAGAAACLLASARLAAAAPSYDITKVTSFPLSSAATARIVGGRAGSYFPGDDTAILFTTFNFLKDDGVWGVPSAAKQLFVNSSTTSPTIQHLDNTIHWPNQVRPAHPVRANGVRACVRACVRAVCRVRAGCGVRCAGCA